MLQNISKLKNLEKLDLILQLGAIYRQIFAQNFKQIAIECNQIRSLRLNIKSNDFLSKYGLEVLNTLQFFQNLNFLTFNYWNKKEENFKMSCKTLKDCKQLTHLVIAIREVNDNFFEDIDKHLPQIKYLDITVDNRITDKAMNSLSKLKKLQTLLIHTVYGNIRFVTDLGLIHVINNCSQINSILFNCRPNITHKTIDALIALSLRKPNIRFKHSFNDMERGGYQSYHSFTYTTIDLKGFDLPKNLIINIF
jgi:hypothetical protein